MLEASARIEVGANHREGVDVCQAKLKDACTSQRVQENSKKESEKLVQPLNAVQENSKKESDRNYYSNGCCPNVEFIRPEHSDI